MTVAARHLPDVVAAAAFLILLAATWQRWTHPFIDHGREMNVPLRLLRGEHLYTDIFYHYGPFAPYVNALVYRVVGPHLAALHFVGGLCAAAILLMIRSLALRLMSPWEASLVTILVCVTCALSTLLGSYIQPYAYAALYGWSFAMASLVCAVKFAETLRERWITLAGLCVALAVVSKPELLILSGVPCVFAMTLSAIQRRHGMARLLGKFAIPVIAISVASYGLILRSVPPELLIDDYRAFGGAASRHFAEFLAGTLLWPDTGWAIVSGIGMLLAAVGASGLLGLLLAPARIDSTSSDIRRTTLITVAGAIFLWGGRFIMSPIDLSPLRAAPVVLVGVIAWSGYRCWIEYSSNKRGDARSAVVLLLAIFSLCAISRVVLNVSLVQAYTPFTIPTLFVLYGYLLFEIAPLTLLQNVGARKYARRLLACGGIFFLAQQLVLTVGYGRIVKTVPVETSRLRVFTAPEYGIPLNKAIRFLESRAGNRGTALVSLPQGTILNFGLDMSNPLRLDALTPDFLPPAQERLAERAIESHNVRIVLVANILSPEYGAHAFGVDYNQDLLVWIEGHYHRVADFSVTGGSLRFGDPAFFIRAYERND